MKYELDVIVADDDEGEDGDGITGSEVLTRVGREGKNESSDDGMCCVCVRLCECDGGWYEGGIAEVDASIEADENS